MRRISLSTLLIAVNVGLLLVAVTGVVFAAARLLSQLADDQALARVAQAGAAARNAVERSGGEAQASALLLAERPTLLRLLQSGDRASLASFLAQFQETSQLDGAAVLLDGRLIAEGGAALPWEAAWAASRGGSYFLHPPEGGGPTLLLARAEVPALSGASAMVAVRLDESFSQRIGDEVGLRVRIVPRAEALDAGEHGALQAQVLASGRPAAARVGDPRVYLALQPLSAPDGEAMGLIETELPSTEVARSLRQLIDTLLLLALGVTVLAGLVNLFLGQRLARPLRRLTNAARHIGHGEMGTPVPAVFSAEIGTLAATLEEMRRRLLRLTADLRRQQAEGQAILTGIVEGVFAVDRERRVRYLNPQAAAMLGLRPEEALGRFCGDVLAPAGTNGARPCDEQCPIVHSRFRAGARATEHLQLRDGGRRTVVITSAPPPDEPQPGEAWRQVQVMRDETEVEAARRLRDAVLANVSHEFRTPLSAQLASIELLLEGLPRLEPEQIEELVRSLQRGTLRLTQLIDNLLESVRIESGEHSIRHRPVRVDEVIDAAVELTRPLIDQRGQRLVVDLPRPMPPALGDAPRLTQVFVNLLANANKFAPEGSTVRVGGVAGETAVSVWVEDQGPGLPPSAGESLFVPFVRSAAEEPEAGGMGLGLWIVKSIVERHGGQVGAHSSGAGTRMVVTLPRG